MRRGHSYTGKESVRVRGAAMFSDPTTQTLGYLASGTRIKMSELKGVFDVAFFPLGSSGLASTVFTLAT